MSSSVVANSCRLTIVSPTLRVDLAVPVHLAVAELLAIVVSSLGREAADLGAAEGGWILQRAGEAPLDPATSLAASQVVDGDVLYLRTRAGNLPEIAFDDVLDAVATGVATRTPRWQPEYTARATAGFAAVLLVFAAVAAVLTGPAWTVPAVLLGAGAVVLVLAAVAVGRGYARRGPALLAGGFAVAYAFGAGATALGGHHRVWHFGAPQLLVGACAAVFVSAVLVVLLQDGVAGFGAVAFLGLLTAVGTGVATGTSLSSAGTASVIAIVALALSPFLPTLAFRLSRLPLPVIPLDATDLRRDSGRVDGAHILDQAVRADQYLSGMLGGIALAIAGSAVVLAGRGVSDEVLAVVLGVICLLRGRLFTGRMQRTLLLVGGAIALLAEYAAVTAAQHGTARVTLCLVPAVVVAVVLAALTITLPGRRYAPPVARAADLVESLLVLAVIPLALGVMGVYGALRHLPHH